MINAGGLVSGMDTNSIVKQLLQLERQPLTNVEKRQSGLQRQISTLGTLSSRLSELSSALKGLSSQESLVKTNTSSSDESSITLSTTGNAQPSQYRVEVQEVAQSAQLRSGSFASLDTVVEEGTMTINAWGEDPVEIQVAAGTTLGQLRDQIASSGAAVDASIVNTGSGLFLNLTAKKSGHSTGTSTGVIDSAQAGDPADALTVSMASSGGGQALGMSVSRQAKNAKLTIDGLAIESTSNEVQGALAGATFNVKAKTTSEVTLAVGVDPSKTAEDVEAFVNKVNATMTAIRSYGEQDRGVSIRMEQELRESLRTVSADGAFANLAQLGITTDYKTGQLSIRKDKLEEALTKDPEAVAKLFSKDEPNGLSAKLSPVLDRYTKTNGIIQNNQEALRGRSKAMDSQIDRYERYLGSYEKQLRSQFTAMEELMNQMTQASNTFASYLP